MERKQKEMQRSMKTDAMKKRKWMRRKQKDSLLPLLMKARTRVEKEKMKSDLRHSPRQRCAHMKVIWSECRTATLLELKRKAKTMRRKRKKKRKRKKWWLTKKNWQHNRHDLLLQSPNHWCFEDWEAGMTLAVW